MENTDDTGMRRAARSAATAGVDLRAGWREARYCAIDVETTGLDLRRDSIISIGSAGIRDGRIVCSDNYYSLIRPACPVSVGSMRIHCLRPADLLMSIRVTMVVDLGVSALPLADGRVVLSSVPDAMVAGRLTADAGIGLTSWFLPSRTPLPLESR